jgi:3'-phosphoadenosine 5'-phosphosulfate sulfotransferase (PAPS reductase)/FAD synthetase
MNSNDAYLQKLLSTTTYKQEALSWLRKPDGKERTIGDGGQDAAASLHLVKDLYQRGAIEVTAIDIETDTHLETTSTLIVKLPQEASARKRVFQTEATIAREGGFDAVDDEGQHYLMLHW